MAAYVTYRWLNHTSGESKKGNWSHDEEVGRAMQEVFSNTAIDV
jgi:hypothetical protein